MWLLTLAFILRCVSYFLKMYWSQYSSFLWGNRSPYSRFFIGSWEVNWPSYFICDFSIQWDILLSLASFPTSSSKINLSLFPRSFENPHGTYFRVPILHIVSLCFHLAFFTLVFLNVYFYFIVPKFNAYFVICSTGCLKSNF